MYIITDFLLVSTLYPPMYTDPEFCETSPDIILKVVLLPDNNDDYVIVMIHQFPFIYIYISNYIYIYIYIYI